MKLRVTFIENERGKKELEEFIEFLKEKDIYEFIHKSKIYKGRGASKYSNIYIDLEKKL